MGVHFKVFKENAAQAGMVPIVYEPEFILSPPDNEQHETNRIIATFISYETGIIAYVVYDKNTDEIIGAYNAGSPQ